MTPVLTILRILSDLVISFPQRIMSDKKNTLDHFSRHCILPGVTVDNDIIDSNKSRNNLVDKTLKRSRRFSIPNDITLYWKHHFE